MFAYLFAYLFHVLLSFYHFRYLTIFILFKISIHIYSQTQFIFPDFHCGPRNELVIDSIRVPDLTSHPLVVVKTAHWSVI